VTAQKTAATFQRLRDLPALSGLAATDVERIAELVCEQSLRRGDVVFREGDPGTAVYIVDAGMVQARTTGRTLSRMGPGEWFGEMALLTGAPRSATVEVVLDCHLLVLDAEAFSRLLALQPRLYERLAAVLSERLARASRDDAHGRSEIVVVDNRASWPERRAIVEALAAALEAELGQDVAVVSIAHRTRPPIAPRPARSDAVLLASRRDPAELRRRLTAQLTDLAHIPIVLVEIDDDLASGTTLADLADVVLVLADATTPPMAPAERQRRIVLYDRRRGPTPSLCDARCAVLPLEERWRSWTIGHLARSVTRRTVGIALGSGIAYGLAHIGVLVALEAAGIPIDFIAGSSIGAIIGAAYALGASATELRATVERLAGLRRPRALIDTLLLLVRDANLVRPGLFGGDRLLEFLETVAPVSHARFSDLVIPYRAVATDLATGERVELIDGTLADAVRASASAPWLLSPWRVGDRVLIDGGMCDPVPSVTVRGMGADLVIAVNAVPPLDPRAQNPLATILGAMDWLNPLSYFEGRRLPNSFEVVMKSLLILQHELGNSRAGQADVLINPALGEFWFLEFWNAPALIEKGAAAARAAVPGIQWRRSARASDGAFESPRSIGSAQRS
jgi:NTE family protein